MWCSRGGHRADRAREASSLKQPSELCARRLHIVINEQVRNFVSVKRVGLERTKNSPCKRCIDRGVSHR